MITGTAAAGVRAGGFADIDTRTANAARVQNYMLGGTDHYAVDRMAAEQAELLMPGTMAMARNNRRHLERVVRFLAAECGVRQFIDTAQRDHATVETDGVRTAKAMGLRNLPSKTWRVNRGWVLAADIAADLTAWARLLSLHDQEELRDATPDTLRYRLWHVPARLVRHARKRILKISPDWPWKEAFITCWNRLCAIPAPG